MLFVVGDLGFPLAELMGEFGSDFVDGRVEIVLGILREHIGARHGEVDFHHVLLDLRLVVQEHHMGREDALGDTLEVRNFIGDIPVDGCGESEVARAEVDLHKLFFEYPLFRITRAYLSTRTPFFFFTKKNSPRHPAVAVAAKMGHPRLTETFMKTILDEILADVAAELASAKAARPPSEIRKRLADLPPPKDFAGAFAGRFALIAEVKERSPSVGPMLPRNVAEAPAAYSACGAVAAVSVLTNATHFGMSIERIAQIAGIAGKPALRKDFIIDEYMVREARVFGADAILLMANVLDAARLKGFYDLARELGMQAIFEVHEESEILALPADALLIGVNSRKFKSRTGFVSKGEASEKDFSLDMSAFELAAKLPEGTIKIAESGLSPETVTAVRERFDAALVGTSILRDPRGPAACLADFVAAIGG